MDHIDPNLVIALISVLIAFVALVVTISRNGHTDVQKQLDDAKEAAKRDTEIKMGLQNIQADTSEIKNDMGGLKSEVASQGERLTIVEQSTKSAHHRIDTLESRTNERGYVEAK